MSTESSSASLPLLPEHLRAEPFEELSEVSWPSDYKQLESLGSGGCAEVFRAVHLPSGQRVAVKTSRPGTEYTKRFAREIEVLRSIRHPNVVEVLDAGNRWYSMPLAEGSLTALAPELGDDDHIKLVEDVVAGLAAVHAAGGPHRDVTPNNILRMGGRWTLADFGLVRRPFGESSAPQTRGLLGTHGFIAPEIAILGAHSADHRADIYSLGRTIAFMTTGRWPRDEAALPVPAFWEPLVSNMTARALASRLQTVEEVRIALVDVRSRLLAKRRAEWSQLPRNISGLLAQERMALRRILRNTTDAFRESDVFGRVAKESRLAVNIGLVGLKKRKFLEDACDDHGEVWGLRLTDAARDWLLANVAALESDEEPVEQESIEPPPEADAAPF